jgi:hypothetical protein
MIATYSSAQTGQKSLFWFNAVPQTSQARLLSVFTTQGTGLAPGILVDLVADRLHKMACGRGLRRRSPGHRLRFRDAVPHHGAETWARSPWPCFMNTGADKKGHFLATAETLISERDFENQFYREFGLLMNMGRFHEEAGDQLYCSLHRSAIPMCWRGEHPRIPSSRSGRSREESSKRIRTGLRGSWAREQYRSSLPRRDFCS